MHRSSTSCSEPEETSLYNTWVQYLNDENSQSDNMFLLPALRETIAHELNKSDNKHVLKYRMSGSDICPDDVNNITRKRGTIEQRSLCPWFYTLNYDPYR